MSISFARAFARVALVCLVTAASLGTVFVRRASAAGETSAISPRTTELVAAKPDGETRGHYVSTPMKLRLGGQDILAYPPVSGSASPPMAVVYLHGVHGRAENGCPWFRGGASEVGWLVCPEGAVHEANGTASWGGDVFAQGAVVSRALRAAEEHGASSEPGVAVGFSEGGYVALDLVKTHQARFRGLVLIAAPEAHPSARKLHETGVVRVALAAGSEDAAYAPLVEDTKRLQREGMDARFYDLGHVGHTYAAEDTTTLRDAIAWASGIGE
jgi:predicted esterase